MKTLLLTAFLFCTFLLSKAQNSKKMETTQDSLAITQVLEGIYFKGKWRREAGLTSRAF